MVAVGNWHSPNCASCLFGMRPHTYPQVQQYLAAVKNVEKGNVDVPLAVAILRARELLPCFACPLTSFLPVTPAFWHGRLA